VTLNRGKDLGEQLTRLRVVLAVVHQGELGRHFEDVVPCRRRRCTGRRARRRRTPARKQGGHAHCHTPHRARQGQSARSARSCTSTGAKERPRDADGATRDARRSRQ
jgi:hypothetical protein